MTGGGGGLGAYRRVRALLAPINLEVSACSQRSLRGPPLSAEKRETKAAAKSWKLENVSSYAESGFHPSLDDQSGSVCELLP